jgi:maltose alpha-D-glucosyltransferase/alpha-amylase
LAELLLGAKHDLFSRLHSVLDEPVTAMRIRCHGDYRLEEILHTGKDFVVVDFEGDRDRPISERRLKTSALRDVAGMLHSFRRAAATALEIHCEARMVESAERSPLERWLQFWAGWTSAVFLRSYVDVAGTAAFLPTPRKGIQTLLDVYTIEKCALELQRYLENRLSWVDLPINEILRVLKSGA